MLTKSIKAVFVLFTQSCLALCGSSPPGYSVPGILQARILEWIANFISRGSFRPRGWTHVSHIAGRFFTIWALQVGPENILSGSTHRFPCLRHDNQLQYLQALGFLVWSVFSVTQRTLCSFLSVSFALTPESLLQVFFFPVSEQVSES